MLNGILKAKGNESKRFRVTANCVGYSAVVREVELARQRTAKITINKKKPFLILRGGKYVLIFYSLDLVEFVSKMLKPRK